MSRPAAERGSVSVVTAAVVFLAGVLSLVAVDLLRTIQAQSSAQAAADAAALAAAQELAIPSGAWTPADAADWYARTNGAILLACRCDPGSGEAVVSVRVPVRLVFVGADRTVDASARAVVGTGAASSEAAGRMARDVRFRFLAGPGPPRRTQPRRVPA